jgi:hypothetical protein
MIFDGQASATGYRSLQVVASTLSDARQKDADGQDIWATATIIAVPGCRLAIDTSHAQRKALNNGVLFNTFNDIIVAFGRSQRTTPSWSTPRIRPAQKRSRALFYMDGLALKMESRPDISTNKICWSSGRNKILTISGTC